MNALSSNWNPITQKIDTSKNEIHEKKLSNQRLEGEMNVINQQILLISAK